MKVWKIISGLEIICFILGSIFLWFRKIDGTGAVNTLENKLISIGVLGVVLGVLLIIQGICYLLLKRD